MPALSLPRSLRPHPPGGAPPCRTLAPPQGVNTPDSILEISCLTPKDRADLDYMLSIGVDWVALSFVQRPEDIVEIRRLILAHK